VIEGGKGRKAIAVAHSSTGFKLLAATTRILQLLKSMIKRTFFA
jgi:hypothetical protein